MKKNLILIFIIFLFNNEIFSQNNQINKQTTNTMQSEPLTPQLQTDTATEIHVLELRNYILKPGKRDSFINYFEQYLINPQIDLGGYPYGQFRVKEKNDNFFWIRGFANMATRSKFLPAFYRGPVWKKHKGVANPMLVNNDNVYLLKPLTISNGLLVKGKGIDSKKLKIDKGIAVVDFYIANTKLDKLITFFSKTYVPVLKNNNIENYTLWISELTENDFPALPVFQDKNLLVAITFYKDELEYQVKQKQINAALSNNEREDLQDIVTIKNSLILYPTKKTLHGNK